MKPLRELVPDAKYPLRLVEADLSKADSWAKAVNRCTYVFHVASPFILNVSDEAAIIRTAVEGTTNVLQACADAGTVKRVVVTSSVAAISCGQNGDPEKPVDYVYTEKDWSPEAHCDPYEKSKLKAEQAAWDFVKNLDESKRFELAVVNPAYIQGPLLSAHSGEGSKEVCERILGGKIPALPDTSFPVVDVRDVAAAHIAAMEKSEAAGNRYLLSNKLFHMREFADIIRNEFGPQGYKIASKNMPKPLVWVGKLFIPSLKGVYRSLGKTVQYNNEQMVNTLGIQPRPVEESLIDLCYSLVDLGIVKKTRGYLGHPSTRPTPPPPEEPANEGAAESTADQAKEDEPAETGTGEEAPQPAAEEEGEKGEDKPPADGQTEEAKPEGEAGSEEQPTS